ncbi:MAG TPA: galactose-1-epimerase [Ruminiclostridium sp.]|nr:galactose-1-epimerase [Ruminiclostridium sp.]
MHITETSFGYLPDGRQVSLYTLVNRTGMKAEIINYGGIIVSLTAPDRQERMSDVLLGFDSLEGYIEHPWFGSLIGRHANRIEGAEITINGVCYKLTQNEGNHQLHGGEGGFHQKLWDSRILSDGDGQRLELSCFSPDGEEGYPGNLETRVIYSLTNENLLQIQYFAVADQDTVVNLTNHAYFNLSGCQGENILSHSLELNAGFYTPVNSDLIPTGEILRVQNTPFDFLKPNALGDGLAGCGQNEQLGIGSGYDHNFVLNISEGLLGEAARVYDPASGRLMKVYTTCPGLQLYTGNYLDETMTGKGGVAMAKWQGLCLETQYFPNSMKYPHFPSPLLKAGMTYHHTTIYQFTAQ